MHEHREHGKIAIVGAGSVGTTIAYAIMIRGLARQILLTDLNVSKAEGEVKDLNHGLRFVPGVRIAAGQIADLAHSEIIIITAGAKQKPGQTRLDLAAANLAMFRQIIPQLVAVAPAALLLIVSNPVDVLTHVATLMHPEGDRRVLGSGTVLDSSRLVTLLAERLGVSVRNVHAQIVGEHGESELALWSSAHVGNVPLLEFESAGGMKLSAGELPGILARVRSAAAEIIAAKGATNWAIGLATAKIVEAIRRDENTILTVSRLLTDYQGISDVCLSVPCQVNARGAEWTISVPMSEDELTGLRASADVMRRVWREASD